MLTFIAILCFFLFFPLSIPVAIAIFFPMLFFIVLALFFIPMALIMLYAYTIKLINKIKNLALK